MITGKLYDGLRMLAQIVLPVVGTIYFFVAGADDILGVMMAVVCGLGIFLWMSQRVYARYIGQGDLIVEEDDAGTGLRLALDRTPEELMTMREVRFEVKRKHDPTPV